MKENEQQKTNKTHRLTAEQLKQATIILEQEQKNCRLSSFHKASYHILKISLIIFLVNSLIIVLFPIVSLIEENSTFWVKAIFILYASLTFVPTLFLPVFFMLNIPLMWKAWRRNKLFKKYKSLELKDYQLRSLHKKNRFMNMITNVNFYIGILFIISLLVLIFNGKFRVSLLIGIWFLYGVALLVWLFIRNSKLRLESLAEMNRMQQSFLRHQQEAEQNAEMATSIPKEDFERIASIEKSQIAHKQVKAIEHYYQELKKPSELRTQTYFVRNSSEVLKKIKELNSSQRLLILTQMEELMINPRPEDSKKDTNSGMWRKRIQESSLEFIYTIEELNRIINIIDIVDIKFRGGSTLATQTGGYF